MLRTHSSECREPVSMGCDFLVISVEREITIESKPSEATLGRRTDKHTQGHTTGRRMCTQTEVVGV